MGKAGADAGDALGVARVTLLKVVRYKARINYRGWQLNLGRFPDVHSAKLAYDQALLSLRGPDNPTNYPLGSYPLDCPVVRRRIDEFTSMLQAKGVVPAGHFSSTQGDQQTAAAAGGPAAAAADGPLPQPAAAPEPSLSGNSSATIASGGGSSGWMQQHSSSVSCAGGSTGAMAAAGGSPPAAQLLSSLPACLQLAEAAESTGAASSTTIHQQQQEQPSSWCWPTDSTPTDNCSSNASTTTLAGLGAAAPPAAAEAAGTVTTTALVAGADEEDDFLRLLDSIPWDDDPGTALLQQCLPSPAPAATPAAVDAAQAASAAAHAAAAWPASSCGGGAPAPTTHQLHVRQPPFAPQHQGGVTRLSNSIPPQAAAPFSSPSPLNMPGGSSNSSSRSQAAAGHSDVNHQAASTVGQVRTALLNLHRCLSCAGGAGGIPAERAATLWLSGFLRNRPDDRAILAVLGTVLGEACSMLSSSGPAVAINPGSSSSSSDSLVMQLLGVSAAARHQVGSSSVLMLVQQAERAMSSLQLQLQALAVAHLQQQVQLRILQLGGSGAPVPPAPGCDSTARLLYQWISCLPGVCAAGSSAVDAAVVRVAQTLASELLRLTRFATP